MFGKEFSLKKGAVGPTGAIADFLAVWRSQGPIARFVVLGAACLPTMFLILGMMGDLAVLNRPPPPEVIYVESWRLDRSREEILADQAERQRLRAIRQEEVRQRYKALGRASGMDVEAIEREAAAEKAALEAAKARQAKTDKDT